MAEEKNMDQGQLLSPGLLIAVARDVLRRWYLVAAAMIAAAMLAMVFVHATYTPQYQTNTTFVATAGGASTTTYQNLSAANTLAAVFTEMLNSSLLQQEVMKETGITSFDGTISASVIEETNLLTMTVTGSDPREVFLVSRALIDHHDVVSYQVLGSTVLEVLQQPRVPAAPSNPLRASSTVLRAALITAAAVCLLLAWTSWRSDRIRSREEADRRLRCHVLGELRHERKYKTLKEWLKKPPKSILITNPLTGFLYNEAVSKLAGRVERRLQRKEKAVLVTSLLENEGKSTVAVNLALALAKKGRKVLLLDCDLRKPACNLILDGDPSAPGVEEILSGKAKLSECIRKVDNSKLKVVAGRKSLTTATDLMDSEAMGALLAEAAEKFSVIIVDTPPMSMAPDAECVAAHADAAVMVVRQNMAAAADVNRAAKVLEDAPVHLLGCVLNDVYGAETFVPAQGRGISDRYGYGRYGYGYGKYGYGRRSADSTANEEK